MSKSKGAKTIDKILDCNFFLYIICIIGFISGAVTAINIIDYTPATKEDYKPLFEIQANIIEDFNNVYNYPDSNIDITPDNIIVYVYNKECSLKIIFDKYTNYLYTEKKDNAANNFILLLGIIVYGFVFTIAVIFLSLFILFSLHTFFEWNYDTKEKRKKQKNIKS